MLQGIAHGGYDRVVVMGADLSHPPERILDRLAALDVGCGMAEDCYTCLLGTAIALLDNVDNGAAAHANRIAAWLARAEALHGQALSKGESAQLPFEQGRLAELIGDPATAAARYRQSHALYPHPANPAADALRRLGLAP